MDSSVSDDHDDDHHPSYQEEHHERHHHRRQSSYDGAASEESSAAPSSSLLLLDTTVPVVVLDNKREGVEQLFKRFERRGSLMSCAYSSRGSLGAGTGAAVGDKNESEPPASVWVGSSVAVSTTTTIDPSFISSPYYPAAATNLQVSGSSNEKDWSDHDDESVASSALSSLQSHDEQPTEFKLPLSGVAPDAPPAANRSVASGSSTMHSGSGHTSTTSTEPRPMLPLPDSSYRFDRTSRSQQQRRIDSLVEFSCHVSIKVMEDLIQQELQTMLAAQSSANSLEYGGPDYSSGGSSDSHASSIAVSLTGLDDDDSEDETSKHAVRPKKKRTSATTLSPPIHIPQRVTRSNSALLFVDINGFTKLSTQLDVESLSKVINSYFECIVNEVLLHGGDILKFAGDAFFAEWRVVNKETEDDPLPNQKWNVSLSSSMELSGSFASLSYLNTPLTGRKSAKNAEKVQAAPSTMAQCVLQAAQCATSIVQKFSDYRVGDHDPSSQEKDNMRQTTSSSNGDDMMLNVHCGVGVGSMVGLHVVDYPNSADKKSQEEAVVEPQRREYLFLGDAIAQVSRAEAVASHGQVYASPEAIQQLAVACPQVEFSRTILQSAEPQCIASKEQVFLPLPPPPPQSQVNEDDDGSPMTHHTAIAKAYSNLRDLCRNLPRSSLARLQRQLSLYVHPVSRRDTLAAAMAGTLYRSYGQDSFQDSGPAASGRRNLEGAELRSVYVMFIKVLVPSYVTGDTTNDEKLCSTFQSIMHVTSRGLDRYSGQLRQFIVDDKGVVLIATFGLRGSTFPSLVFNNALPATIQIHRALKEDLNVDNRIGATYGQVYCGLVGGVRRHEFSVMGAAVNLAARLMDSSINEGVLVDAAVKVEVGNRFEFRSLPPVKAKGYDGLVSIFEPLQARKKKRGNALIPFAGRWEERQALSGCATEILEYQGVGNSPSSVINLMGESGSGKTALVVSVLSEIKNKGVLQKRKVLNLRSSCRESEQKVPLCAFRRVFLGAIKELCLADGSFVESGNIRYQPTSKRYLLDPDTSGASLSPIRSDRRANDRRWSFSADPKPAQPEPVLRQKVQTLGAPESRKAARISDLRHSHGPRTPKDSLRSSGKKVMALSRTTDDRRNSFSSTSPMKPKLLTSASKRSLSTSQRSLHQSLKKSEHTTTTDNRQESVPYLDKLCWACEKIGYPHEYADLVSSQFLGIDGAMKVTDINGEPYRVDDLVEFVAQAFMKITEFADLITIFIDDFQWVDSFTWKVIRALGQSGRKMLLICAMRAHDKQALRRISTAVNFRLEITLSPLELCDIKELICVSLADNEVEVDDDLCAQVYEKTGGLPVYVVDLLEGVKRSEAGKHGKLRLLEKMMAQRSSKRGNSALVESLLNRFDSLPASIRKVLQTCAVLGSCFSLSDLVRVHPNLNPIAIEKSLDVATVERILIEIIEDDDESKSEYSHSTAGSDSNFGSSIEYSRTSSARHTLGDRFYEFSHDKWRTCVLKTMLNEKKTELHRMIAETMEQEQASILKRGDIGRLLALFDHWKCAKNFEKAAPLALAVGETLDEWDLIAQSLDLYRDALDMCYDNLDHMKSQPFGNPAGWFRVSADSVVFENILALQIRIAEGQRLTDDIKGSVQTLEDAYRTLNTCSSPSRQLLIAVLGELCLLNPLVNPDDEDRLRDQEIFIQHFIKISQEEGDNMHLSRALALDVDFHATTQKDYSRAVHNLVALRAIYEPGRHSTRMEDYYGQDFAADCLAHSVFWYFLKGDETKACAHAEEVVRALLPYQNPQSINEIMRLLLPSILVLKFCGRAADADYLVKRFVINAHHDLAPFATYWVETFNPLCYLLEVVKMEDRSIQFDMEVLGDIEEWVLEDKNSYFTPENLRLCHTLMGELCWRLGNLKPQVDDNVALSEQRQTLFRRAKWFLTPIARDPDTDPFLAHSALAYLKQTNAYCY